MLLSGSVIGGVEDLGAVYYNPARLSVIANPAFLLSASVYEYNKLSITDAFGSSTSAAKAEVRGVPSLAAGTFKLKFLPNHFFAYAVMSRQLSDLSTSYSNEVTQDVFTTLPGNEIFSGELGYTYKGNPPQLPIWNGIDIGLYSASHYPSWQNIPTSLKESKQVYLLSALAIISGFVSPLNNDTSLPFAPNTNI